MGRRGGFITSIFIFRVSSNYVSDNISSSVSADPSTDICAHTSRDSGANSSPDIRTYIGHDASGTDCCCHIATHSSSRSSAGCPSDRRLERRYRLACH